MCCSSLCFKHWPIKVKALVLKIIIIHRMYTTSCENHVFLFSIHLSCWLDLEQYRRTDHKDKAVRLERSSQIATKYLNRKYFFGPDSPATTQQQSDVSHIGWVLNINVKILVKSKLPWSWIIVTYVAERQTGAETVCPSHDKPETGWREQHLLLDIRMW